MGRIRSLTPIGSVFAIDGPLIVNGWSHISSCMCHNCVLYRINYANFLDLRDCDIHWFKRDAEVWWTQQN